MPRMSTSTATESTRATSYSGSTSLRSLVERGAKREEIASHLDALGSTERLAQVLVEGERQPRQAGEPLGVDDFAPPAGSDTLILEGRNSLPAFSRFQKRFTRIGEITLGYNHQTMSPLTGPGYFVVRPPTPGETHPDELFFDYTIEPPRGAPRDWPAFSSNKSGLSRLVYMDMKDFCRRVAKGVLVGKAYKRGIAQDAYFTLTKPF